MKTIAIITLHNVKNYGSILQAYATQNYFKELGLDPILIDYRRPWETSLGYWFYLNDKSLKGIARNIMYFPSKILQLYIFKNFQKKYLTLTHQTYVKKADFESTPIHADIYCTGSDQVWNSGWNEGVITAYFLDFIHIKSKKISFAASFGCSNLTNKDKDIIKPLLDKYSLITVREEPSVDMLKNTFGLDAYEILDPTLQLSGDFWRNLCNPKRLIRKPYVLIIQLNRNHIFDNLAQQFVSNKKLKLVRLCLRVDQAILPGKSVIIPKVEDYIRLIRDAEYVLTDSFHAVSFCLNLEKQFYVYFPSQYSERLKSILSIMQLTNRELALANNYDDEIDYREIQKILFAKRKFTHALIKSYIDSEC